MRQIQEKPERHAPGFLYDDSHDTPNARERLQRLPWGLLLLLVLVAIVGGGVLYSAVGGGENLSLLLRQSFRFGLALFILCAIALWGDDKFFRRYSYLIYGAILFLLVIVALMGTIGMGARRWLDLGFFRLQPSELMKVAVVMALARFYHDRTVSGHIGWRQIAVPMILVAIPVVLIAKQPDLGTAVLVAAAGGVVIFVAGLPWKAVVGIFATLGASLPLAWNWLHEYQKKRILTLFFPEEDPLGSGYHIIQSKIAVGSGGLLGKGFMGGSQSHLDFLPERHTDFVFSVLAEEWGFIGSVALLILYGLIILRGILIASSARDRYGLLLACGLTSIFAFHVVINIGMVLGLLPVVGIPLPLVSYGGSSMLTVMAAMGLLAHVSIHSKYHGRPPAPV
ncbi:MAG: rod shape-determining protein RodA [Magnetococcales bacterium]|nr:rod shape-determining protein RodA [Magnetococcales bacterium]